MAEIKEKYEPYRLDALERRLKRDAQDGNPTDYEVFINDDIKIVSRTRNLDHFRAFEEEIDPDTRTLTFALYEHGNNNRNTKYTYTFKDDLSPSLNGTDDGQVAALQQKVAQLEAEKRELTEERDRLKVSQFSLGGFNIADLGSAVVEKLIARNAPKLLDGTALSGLFGTPEAVPAPPPAEVTFERQPAAQQLSPEQLRRLENLNVLEHTLNPQQMAKTLKILNHFMQHPDHIDTVAELLNIRL